MLRRARTIEQKEYDINFSVLVVEWLSNVIMVFVFFLFQQNRNKIFFICSVFVVEVPDSLRPCLRWSKEWPLRKHQPTSTCSMVIATAFLFIYLELASYIKFELPSLGKISSQPATYVSVMILTVQLTEIKGEFWQILSVCILSNTAVLEPVKLHYITRRDIRVVGTFSYHLFCKLWAKFMIQEILFIAHLWLAHSPCRGKYWGEQDQRNLTLTCL